MHRAILLTGVFAGLLAAGEADVHQHGFLDSARAQAHAAPGRMA
jgi:hypothetical protein